MGYYNSISGGYDELYGEEQARKLEIIKPRIKINEKSSLLDVGCGSGLSSDLGCFVVGIDPSMELLKRNRSKIRVNGAAEGLPFKDNSFDWVISVTAMHNFYDIHQAINEILRVGKGSFAFSVLKKSKNFGKIENLIKNSFEMSDIIDEGKDVIYFCAKSIKRPVI